jgi:hypothetical protein
MRRYLLFLLPVLPAFIFSLLIQGQTFADEPVFSKERGFYNDSFTLTISHSLPGCIIKITKDGTNPYTSSTAISLASPASIIVDPIDNQDRDRAPGVVIRACAVKDGALLTKIATHTYLFLDKIAELSPDGIKPGSEWPDSGAGTHPTPGNVFEIQGMNYGMDPEVLNDPRYQGKIKEALLSIPTISLVTDLKNLFDPDSGIYVNALHHDRPWERTVSAELINPDGSEGFQIDGGLRIRGGWGRSGTNFKHAFRLFFREEYGKAKLKFPLFEDEGISEFDNIDLRTSQNYSWAYPYGGDGDRYTELREVFSRDTQRDMGQPYTRSRYYHLYINGTYWGLYQTQERAEASYAESYFGGNKDDYDVVKVDTDSLNTSNYHLECTDGNMDAYQKLWEIASNGFRTDADYYKVQGLNPDGSRNPSYPVLVDIDNLIDFNLCYFFAADPDGPVTTGGIPNNFYGIYNRTAADRGFLFFRHDAEHSLMSNIDVTGATGTGKFFKDFNPKWLHQQLCNHPGYRLRFYDRVFKHFFNGGALTSEACYKRMLTRKNQIEDAVIAESARWGDAYSIIPHTRDYTWEPEADSALAYVSRRSAIVLNQIKKRGLYPSFEPPVFDLNNGLVTRGTTLNINSPEGTIYYTLDGNDTHLPASLQVTQQLLIPRNAEKHILIPSAAVDPKWRTSTEFDDSQWSVCNSSPGTIGYDLGTQYKDQISYNVETQMHNVNASCMIRIPFEVTQEQINSFNYLILRVQYDDGIAVYFNKSSAIILKNSSSTLTWNSAATAEHDGNIVEAIDLTSKISYLVPGKNMLAIQAFNIRSTDSDFFISVELVAGNMMKSNSSISPSAIAYSAPITINHNTKIKARVYKDEQWSALNEISLYVPEGNENLRISEINYHPLPEGDIDEKELEFLEFKNIGNETLDISGFTFTKGITYTFPSGTTIKPGAHLVLASNDTAFESRYKFTPFAEYKGQLGNGGDTLILNTSDGKSVINLIYKDSYPWPNSPDGSGHTLVCHPSRLFKDQNDASNWGSSKDINGNPGNDDDVTEVDNKGKEQPYGFRLAQNYPNPFNPVTRISYQLPFAGIVKLCVFDILGREVVNLVNREQIPGNYTVNFNGTGLPSGVYFYMLSAGNSVEVKKMMLLK